MLEVRVLKFFLIYIENAIFYTEDMSSSIISQKKIKVRRAIISEDEPSESNQPKVTKVELTAASANSLGNLVSHAIALKLILTIQLPNTRNQPRPSGNEETAGESAQKVRQRVAPEPGRRHGQERDRLRPVHGEGV